MQFKPVITLVGRANVGKSTLFNRVTRSRDALVANFPGLTRDRHYGQGYVGKRQFIVIDTGGFEPVAKEGILQEMAKQTEQAIAESDAVVFLVDARVGLNAHDHEIAQLLRRSGRRVFLAVNKAEGMRYGSATSEFHELGLGEPYAISASHGDGVADLFDLALDAVLAEADDFIPEQDNFEPEDVTDLDGYDDIALEEMADDVEETQVEDSTEEKPKHRIKLAIVGRPNVGKSTLINALLGEDRVIAFDMPGTTRDAIEIEFDHGKDKYTLIDTAGLRRRGKVFETIEKFSVIKTLQAIQASNVVVLMLDAFEGVSEQDAHIAGFVLETGRALVLAVNKWDATTEYQREQVMRDLNRKLRFLSFANMHKISALNRQGIRPLLKSVKSAHTAAFAKLSTPKLTRAIHAAVQEQQPPRKGIFRPKLRYAHQGGQNPPRIIVHGNALDSLPESYRRYLESRLQTIFKLQGTPLVVEFKSSHNPYAKKD